MGLAGGIGRTIAIPLLLLNLAFAVIVLGFNCHFLDKVIAGKFSPLAATNPTPNPASQFFILLSLLASVVCVASYISGAHHLRLFRADTGSAAQASAWIAWLILILAFVLAWKEIHIGHRPVKLRVAEAFVIMLTVTHFIYAMLLHAGHRGENTATGTGHHKPMNPNAPAAASAV